MISSLGFLVAAAVAAGVLLVGEETWSLVSGLYELEVNMEGKLGNESLDERCTDRWVKEVAVEEVVVVAAAAAGERIGMEAINLLITYPLLTEKASSGVEGER